MELFQFDEAKVVGKEVGKFARMSLNRKPLHYQSAREMLLYRHYGSLLYSDEGRKVGLTNRSDWLFSLN